MQFKSFKGDWTTLDWIDVGEFIEIRVELETERETIQVGETLSFKSVEMENVIY